MSMSIQATQGVQQKDVSKHYQMNQTQNSNDLSIFLQAKTKYDGIKNNYLNEAQVATAYNFISQNSTNLAANGFGADKIKDVQQAYKTVVDTGCVSGVQTQNKAQNQNAENGSQKGSDQPYSQDQVNSFMNNNGIDTTKLGNQSYDQQIQQKLAKESGAKKQQDEGIWNTILKTLGIEK